MKRLPMWVALGGLTAALLAGGMAGAATRHAPAAKTPTLTILSPSNGAALTDGTFVLRYKTNVPGETQAQVYVDGVLKAQGSSSSLTVRGISSGTHELEVVPISAAGVLPFSSIESIHVGPSIQITAPADGTVVGSTVTLHIHVFDFTLAAMEIGKPVVLGHGHYHIYVDGHWANAGVGPTITVNLTPGPHVIVATLANNNHTPLDPSASSLPVVVIAK